MRSNPPLLKFFSILIILGGVSGSTFARVFTDKHGNQYDGSVMSQTSDEVTIMIPSKGKIYKLAIADLSAEDRAYLIALKNKNSQKTRPAAATHKPPVNKTNQPNEKETLRTSRKKQSLPTALLLKKQHNLPDNFLTKWPTFVKAPPKVHVNVIKSDAVNQHYVYHTPSYEFICDAPLSATIVSEFGVIFEATREYCRLLPISSMKAHIPKGKKRHRVLLFENIADYVKNGGHPSAAGVYIPAKDIILIPLSSLSIRKAGNTYNYDYRGSNNVLVHEMAHQLTDIDYYAHGARGWFSEGLAEYCALTEFKRTGFAVRTVKQKIKDHVIGRRNYIGQAPKFNAPNLEDFFLQSYSSFTANAAFNYRFGAMVTYYFFHMEKDRRNINAFLKALRNGEKGQQALNKLLGGRSYDQLEKDIAREWRASGIDIIFH